jgi:hypothetical protein
MEYELTLDQARVIAHLRRRHPGATLTAHQRPWGVIVEVTAAGRTRQVTALHAGGRVQADQPVFQAAA